MTDIKDYWARKEAEIGETIDAKFYCTYISGDESAKGPLTGVLFFSRSTLSFQSFYAAKDLKSLFQFHSQKYQKSPNDPQRTTPLSMLTRK